MSWVGSRYADIYFGTQRVAVSMPGEPLRTFEVKGNERAASMLEQWVGDQQRPPAIRLWLSGGLCRPFMLPQIARASSAELERIAATLVPEHIGWTEPAVVRVDAVREGRGAMAVAMKTQVLEDVKRAAGDGGRRIASIQPWWAEVLRLALASKPAAECLVVQDCDSVCMIAGKGSSIEAAVVSTPIEDSMAAEAAIVRLTFAQGLQSPPLIARLRFGSSEPTRDEPQSTVERLVEWSA